MLTNVTERSDTGGMKTNDNVRIFRQGTQRTSTATPATVTAWIGLLLSGAIFGFFYAWVCSTMWGLDAADPRVAIAAMQAMNDSVRNVVFFPVFFLTPVALGIAAALAYRERRATSAALLAIAALTYLFGGLILTMMLNVPMNEELARVAIPAGEAEARAIWQEYSSRWQVYNQARTVASGTTLGLVGVAMLMMHRQRDVVSRTRGSGAASGGGLS